MMNYPDILGAFLHDCSYAARTGRRRFLVNMLEPEMDETVINIDLTKPTLEVPADLAQNILNNDGQWYTYLYPLHFKHKTCNVYTVGTTALWTCIAESRSTQHEACDTRCFKLLTDHEGHGLYVAPGMVFDNDKNCLFRIIARLERQLNNRYKPLGVVMYIAPSVFTAETPITKAIIKTLIPEFLKQNLVLRYYNTDGIRREMTVPLTVEIKDIDLSDLKTITAPTPSTFSNEELCKCLSECSRVLYDRENLLR